MLNQIPFTTQMRKATREIHDLSDSLVNAKLGLALSNDEVWTEGLLVFYEVFRCLEEAMDKLHHTVIGELDIPGMRRVEAFKDDLRHYLGPGWTKDYEPRESVIQYVRHLQQLQREDHTMLMAYIYHLYMGLLSGGQLLKQKRVLLSKFKIVQKSSGNAVTDFGDVKISTLKSRLRQSMNEVAAGMDEDTKQRLIEESKVVFKLNNDMIRTIRGAGEVVLIKIGKAILYCLMLIVLVFLLTRSL